MNINDNDAKSFNILVILATSLSALLNYFDDLNQVIFRFIYI